MNTQFIAKEITLDRMKELHDSYQQAQPFPHIGLQRFFNEEMLKECINEVEKIDFWYSRIHENSKKYYQNEAKFMGKVTNDLLAYLNTSEFITFLEQLSGITNLLPDDGNYNGITKIPQGGYLDVHIDFNQHKYTKHWRRVNLLLYLNNDWLPEYGGGLSLWKENEKVVEYQPIANQTVIFTCSEKSYHGHPDPLNCPSDRFRYALNSYYYTVENPYPSKVKAHSTVYRKV